MGLGLYVSALLAKQMGARLDVQSLRRGGARVVVAFEVQGRSEPSQVEDPP